MVKLLANRLLPMLVSQILSVVVVALLQHMILNSSDCCDARQASIEKVSGCHELGNDLVSFSAIQRKWLQRVLCMLCFAGLMFAPTWLSEPEVLASAKTPQLSWDTVEKAIRKNRQSRHWLTHHRRAEALD